MPDEKIAAPITGKNLKYPITGWFTIKSIRGRVIPCDGCKWASFCAIYHSIAQSRLHGGQYARDTNLLGNCEIYQPNRMPGNIKIPKFRSRTRGNSPT